MASGNVETRERRIPKAAEKKVKIVPPEPIKLDPQPKPKVSADAPSRSWYTPAPAQSLATDSMQKSVPNATPRTTLSKVDMGKSNPAKKFRGHGRTESEARGNGVKPTKRPVPKHLIARPDRSWSESTNNQATRNGYLAQQRPTHFPTRGSYESEEMAVGEVPTYANAGEEEATPLVKSVQETVNPVARRVSKPLPELPVFESVSSRWSASTGSVYSNNRWFSYDKVLDMFPEPPRDMPEVDNSSDWESFNSLPTQIFTSCANTSSSSVATITPTTTPNPPVEPLMLKTVPQPKVATVIHQVPRASCSLTQLQDSIVIRDGRAYPQAPIESSTHSSSIHTTGPPTLRRRSSSFTSSRGQEPPMGIADIRALVWPHRRQTPEDIKRTELEELERENKYKAEQEEQEKLRQFYMEFGFIRPLEDKKGYQREVDPNGLEFFEPGKEKKRRWL